MLDEIRATGVAHNATSFYESRDEALVSEDRSAALIPVGLQGDCEGGRGPADRRSRKRRTAATSTCSSRASAARTSDLNRILDEDLKTGELYFGLPAALVILVLVFGALVAAVVPLLVALFSIGIALGLAALLSQGFDLSVFLFQMTTVMGLAIATDYGLFIVSRYREERASRANGARCHRRLGCDRKSRCAVQRHGVRARDVGPASRARFHPAQPRRRAR